MHARFSHRVALTVAASILSASGAVAGGGGHGVGPVVHAGGGLHGGLGGHGGWGGGGRSGSQRGMPPAAGVIHERYGMRPYYSAYGHTDTAARFGGFAPGGVPAFGHTATGLPYGVGLRPYGSGYGHAGTAPRYGAERRPGEGRRRFAERGFVGGGFVGGGFGGGYGVGDGTYDAAGIYGDAGVYGGQGTSGREGTYGQSVTYGGAGTYATQGAYGTGGYAYRSEAPLAARFAEPPLGPSPNAPYGPNDRYAYAASADVGPAPRVVNPYEGARSDCGCRGEPVVYRYGIGTAY